MSLFYFESYLQLSSCFYHRPKNHNIMLSYARIIFFITPTAQVEFVIIVLPILKTSLILSTFRVSGTPAPTILGLLCIDCKPINIRAKTLVWSTHKRVCTRIIVSPLLVHKPRSCWPQLVVKKQWTCAICKTGKFSHHTSLLLQVLCIHRSS